MLTVGDGACFGVGEKRDRCTYFPPGSSFEYTEELLMVEEGPLSAVNVQTGEKRKSETETEDRKKKAKKTYVVPPNLEIVILTPAGLEEFFTRPNILWLRTVLEGKASFETFCECHQLKLLS